MKKNNGFTLIELLATIIILAAIALVVFPILLNTIKNSEDKIDDATKKLVINAADLYVDENLNTYYKSDKNTYCIPITTLIQSGQLEKGFVGVTENIASNYFVEVKYDSTTNDFVYNISKECHDSYTCNLSNDVDNDNQFDVGDEVTCGTESFYVIPDHEIAVEGTVSLLAKYNLNVGLKLYPNDPEGIQSSNAKGFCADNWEYGYGCVKFSSTNYWDFNSISPGDFVYNEESNLYQYVYAYKNYLQENGVVSITATLPSYKQMITLGCPDNISRCENAPEWVSSEQFWLGSAYDEIRIWDVMSDSDLTGDTYYIDTDSGVRPVIIIPKASINNN